VIAVDTNVLIYAHREESPFHERAAIAFAELAEGRAPWAIPWPCLHEFYAIATHPRVYTPPTPRQRALQQIEAWLESPSLVLLSETAAHWPTLRQLIENAALVGPAVHDARIAALCKQHGVKQVWTADRDFGRFAGLRAVNPLIV